MATHRFAWDGFSFSIPEDWNLSYYDFGRHVSRVRMEDDMAIRLEMDWSRLGKRVDVLRVRERYARKSKTLNERAEEARSIEGLPQGWTAFLYIMPDKRRLLISFQLSRDSLFFSFFRIHFDAEENQKPVRVMKSLASSFEIHEDGSIPWEFYDVSLRMSRDFYLVNTSLQAGRKLMIFQWRLRRLYFWQFSLADMLLKQKSLAAWCAEFLNNFKEIRGVLFFPEDDRTIGIRRNRRYLFGHYDEIGRQCFRYDSRCVHCPDKNAVILTVYNYRSLSDLKKVQDLYSSILALNPEGHVCDG